MKFNDAITGAFFLGIAIFAFVHAGTFKTFPGIPYGPDLFPRIIAVMMGGGGLMLVVSGLRSAGHAPWIRLDQWARQSRGYVIFLAVVGAVLFYIFFAGVLGFLLAGFIMLTGLLVLTRGVGTVVTSVALSAGVVGLLHMLFAEVLRVPLPFGVIERMLVG